MLDDFLIRAAIAGVGAAILAAPLGCFVVWRRMAYFGETVAYSGLLGVALGFLLGIDLTLGVIATAIAMALLLTGFQTQRAIPHDTLLGILAHVALAAGVIATSFAGGARLDLMGYLFGDILAVSKADIAWIWGGAAAVLAALFFLWRPLLAVTVNEELAAAEGVPVRRGGGAALLENAGANGGAGGRCSCGGGAWRPLPLAQARHGGRAFHRARACRTILFRGCARARFAKTLMLKAAALMFLQAPAKSQTSPRLTAPMPR
jgi:hypothetical protein